MIVREEGFEAASGLQRQSNQICVFENNEVVGLGCEMRAAASRLYSCDSGVADLPSYTSSYFAPSFIISMKSNNNSDSTSTVIQPLSVNNSNREDFSVNLAGYKFTSFVTDDTFVECPFTGAKAYGPTTLFGTYKNNAVPYNETTQRSTGAVYLYSLEYVRDQYVQGGKYACARFETTQHCPLNEKNCVLTNRLNRDLVSRHEFYNKAKLYSNMRLCRAADTSCVGIDFIAGKSGGAGLTIFQCGGTTGSYCYKNALNIEVCQISTRPTDRYNPAPDSDPNSITPLADSQYYASGLQQNYDGNLYALRDKSSVELGLCISIPQPVYLAIAVPTIADGNATWPETNIGTQGTGTCVTGTFLNDPTKPLKRYCLSNAINRTTGFDSLDPEVGCRTLRTKIYKRS